jgi:hypothetical protein
MVAKAKEASAVEVVANKKHSWDFLTDAAYNPFSNHEVLVATTHDTELRTEI